MMKEISPADAALGARENPSTPIAGANLDSGDARRWIAAVRRSRSNSGERKVGFICFMPLHAPRCRWARSATDAITWAPAGAKPPQSAFGIALGQQPVRAGSGNSSPSHTIPKVAKLMAEMQDQAEPRSGHGNREGAWEGWKVQDDNGDEAQAEFTNVKRILFQVSDLMPASPSGPVGPSAHSPQTAATESGGKVGQHGAEEEGVNAMPSFDNTDLADNGAFPERFPNSNLAETSRAEHSLNETRAPIADEQSRVVEGGKDEHMEDFGAEEAFPERVAAPSPPEAKNNNPKHLSTNNNKNNNNNGAAAAAGAAEVPPPHPAASSPGSALTGDHPSVHFPYSTTPGFSGEDCNPFARTLNRDTGRSTCPQANIRLLAEEGGLSRNNITTLNQSTALLNACGYDFDSGQPVPRTLLNRLRAQPFAFPRTGLNPFMGAKLGRDWGHPAEMMMQEPLVKGEVGEGVHVPDVLPSTISWGTVFENDGRGIMITREWWEEVCGGAEGEVEVGPRDSGDEGGVKGIEVEGEEEV